MLQARKRKRHRSDTSVPQFLGLTHKQEEVVNYFFASLMIKYISRSKIANITKYSISYPPFKLEKVKPLLARKKAMVPPKNIGSKKSLQYY